MPREGAVDAAAAVEVDAVVEVVETSQEADAAVGVAAERAFQEGAVEAEVAAPQGVAVLAGVELRQVGAFRHRLRAVRKPPGEASRQGLVSASPDKQPRV